MVNILITGGCGFIGSNFIKYILKKDSNIRIINIDKITYAGLKENLANEDKDRYKLVVGDICDANLVNNLFKKYKFQSLINFAAESHVDRSIDGPKDFITTNLLGTFNLLENSRKYNHKNFRFVHISTDEVFGSLGDEGKFLESTPYDPSSPYSATKAGSDHLVRAWNRTYGLPILITNCSNNYGPFQFPEKLIPLTIINCLQKRPLPVYGEGKNIRDWLYVNDHCRAIYKVLLSGVVGETYNIGGNNEIKNIDVVTKICIILDRLKPMSNGKKYSEMITYVKDRPGHDFRYAIDSGKINTQLNWHPVESFDTGLEKTIAWYLDNTKWWNQIQNNRYRQERLGVLNK